jgi:hypothetical protein
MHFKLETIIILALPIGVFLYKKAYNYTGSDQKVSEQPLVSEQSMSEQPMEEACMESLQQGSGVWGWVGLFFVVSSVLFIGTIYFHKENNECLVQEVLTESTARWKSLDDGPLSIDSVQVEIFAEKLSEFSPGLLLFALSELKKTNSVI